MINKETGVLEEGRLKLRVVEKITSLVNKEKDSLKKNIKQKLK